MHVTARSPAITTKDLKQRILTIGNSKNNRWKNVLAHYVPAACGLALAAVAVTNFEDNSSSGTIATAASEHFSQSIPAWQRGPSQHTIFVAGSERQAADHQASVFQDIHPSWYSAYSFVVVSNADEEAQLQYGLDEAAREVSDVTLRVIDLRGR